MVKIASSVDYDDDDDERRRTTFAAIQLIPSHAVFDYSIYL